MSIPDWVPDSVFYQIFPDRFANGDPGNDPANVRPWGSPPTRWHYQGGDLAGITQRLDYLQDLGIIALYLNPIFHSTANHRYHTTDYFKVDPFLGDLDDFKTLLNEAHRRGMRLIIDGVLNHCGRGHFAFADVLENGPRSPYLDWFHIERFPLKAFSRGPALNFTGWWDIKDLPKFNTDNPSVRKHLFGMTRYWTELGLDGWRLDVPNEIDDDEFWAEYRALVTGINPDAYLVGEIWTLSTRWVDEQHFHGLMNYPLRSAIQGELLGDPDAAALRAHLRIAAGTYSLDTRLVMYNLLGSHDTSRLISRLHGHRAKTRLAYAALLGLPGVPSIYYGDEVGLRGGKEPASRGAFPWDESQWDQELRAWIQKLIALRQRLPALRRGELTDKTPQGDDFLVFERRLDQESVTLLLNFSDQTQRYPVLDGGQADLLADVTYAPSEDVIVAPWSATWLQPAGGRA